MSLRKILVVEDDPKILEVYRLIFSGEAVGGSGDGPGTQSSLDCLAYADPRQMVDDYKHMYEGGTQIPVCIVDMRMPKQSGLVTAEQLRAIDPDIDVVISSAYNDFGSAEIRARLRERVYFVRKPFDYEEISLMIESLVDSWEMRQELRRETAFLSSLLESSSDLIFMKDTEGIYLTCNKRFAEFAKCPAEKIIGGTDSIILPAEVCAFYREQDRQVIENGKPITFREEVDRPSGGRCLLETVKSPVRSTDGEVIGILGVARDISRRRADDSQVVI